MTHALPASHFTVLGDGGLAKAAGTLLPTMLLLIGNQGMYQKFFSARSESDARIAVGGWIVGTVILETLLVMLAVIGSSMFKTDSPREIIPLSARAGIADIDRRDSDGRDFREGDFHREQLSVFAGDQPDA